MPGPALPDRPGCSPATCLASGLAAAEITRRTRGMDISRASTSTRDDAVRMAGLYHARFDRNARGGNNPWTGDPLLSGDTRSCDILNR